MNINEQRWIDYHAAGGERAEQSPTDLDGLPQEYRDMVEYVRDRKIFAEKGVSEAYERSAENS